MASNNNTPNKKIKRTEQLQIGRNSVMEACTQPVIVEESASEADEEVISALVLDPSDPKMKYHFSKYPAFGVIGRSELSFQVSDMLEKKSFNDCF